MLKRLFDILLSLFMLALLSPLLLTVAVLVIIDDGLPVFYSQLRVGREFRPFRIWKFRTMHDAVEGESITSFGDPRVTRLGRVLRRTKIDELPQLWNVLTGDMSFVGPRPEIQEYVEAFRERYAKVLTVRPGITDEASIQFVEEESMLASAADPLMEYRQKILPAKLTLAERYVEHHSVLGDLRILFKTLSTILGGR